MSLTLMSCSISLSSEQLVGKEHCILDKEDVTRFTYHLSSYTILEDVVSDSEVEECIGYIHKFALVDANGKVVQEENTNLKGLFSLAGYVKKDADIKYVIPFINVYRSESAGKLYVDVDGKTHIAKLSEQCTKDDIIYDFANHKNNKDRIGEFKIDSENVTKIISDNKIYEIKNQLVAHNQLENFLGTISENIMFDVHTKKQVDTDFLQNKSDQYERWVIQDVFSLQGKDIESCIAVKINGQYYIAQSQ